MRESTLLDVGDVLAQRRHAGRHQVDEQLEILDTAKALGQEIAVDLLHLARQRAHQVGQLGQAARRRALVHRPLDGPFDRLGQRPLERGCGGAQLADVRLGAGKDRAQVGERGGSVGRRRRAPDPRGRACAAPGCGGTAVPRPRPSGCPLRPWPDKSIDRPGPLLGSYGASVRHPGVEMDDDQPSFTRIIQPAVAGRSAAGRPRGHAPDARLAAEARRPAGVPARASHGDHRPARGQRHRPGRADRVRPPRDAAPRAGRRRARGRGQPERHVRERAADPAAPARGRRPDPGGAAPARCSSRPPAVRRRCRDRRVSRCTAATPSSARARRRAPGSDRSASGTRSGRRPRRR